MAEENVDYKVSPSKRVVGMDIPVSIGTAIPLELETSLDVPEYDVLMFNITTLFRNFWGSWNKDNRPPIQAVLSEWIQEVEVIHSLIASMGITPVIFIPDYSGAKKYWRDCQVVEPKTATQRIYNSALKIAISVIVSHETLTAYKTGLFLTPIKGSVRLLTHQPIDLLSYGKFDELKLLESRTGSLKEFSEFPTKLGSKNPRLMFNHFTLIVFGDKSKLFKALPKALRTAVENLAEERRWKPSTTHDKIVYDIKNYLEKDKAEILLRIANKRPLLPTAIKT